MAETLRQCLEENILTPFLASQQKEFNDIMVTLFSQEKVTEIREHNLAQKAKSEGRGQGREEGIAAMIQALRTMNLDQSAVRQILVQQFHLTAAEAERKIQLYWDMVKS